MLTRLREIVEKVASAPRLNEALDILVTDVCQAMETEVCSVYLADNDRRCYYLMATRGLKNTRGRTVALAFDEGLVGLVGRLAEPINLADAQKHPSFKYIPAVKEDRFRAFLGVPIIQRRQLLGVLVVQQRELRQFDESEESFPRHPRHPDGGDPLPVPAERPVRPVSSNAHSRSAGLFRGGDRRGLDGRQPAADGAGV